MAKSQNPKAAPTVVPTAAPTVAPTAAPGTKDAAGTKPPKAPKELFPALGDPEKITPLTGVPTDWDPKKHKPLLKKHFASEDVFLDWRASRLEKEAANLRQQAEESRKLGNVKDRARAKKLLSMQKRLAELKAQLESEGVDADALLASIGADAE